MPNKYKFWRCVAIIGFSFVAIFFAISTFSLHGYEKTIYLYALIPIYAYMLFSLIHQMIFPLDLRIYMTWVLLFSYMAVAYGSTALSIIILYCAYTLGREIRFFTTKPKLKYAIIIILYFLSAGFQYRLPKDKLINSLMEFSTSISAIVAMQIIYSHLLKRINQDIFQEIQKEDINEYFSQYNFTERDKVMLNEVLAGCKYEEIAINHNLSLSSVKKRLAILYKILGVTCQIDFLIKFAPKSENSTKV